MNQELREELELLSGWDIPRCDVLEFLLEKLPYYIDTKDARGTYELFVKKTSGLYFAGYNKPELGKWLYDQNHGVWERPCKSFNCVNALLLLAKELFKEGILTK